MNCEMSERTMRITFSSGIGELKEKNASFDTGVLRVAYTGKNRNNSFISKEAYERCLPSIYNCPIVCNYDRDAGTIGAHDIEIVSDQDGNMRLVNTTQPVGVIPESARYWWEEIEDNSGVHEYLCVDALIWKRQEAYQKIKDNCITAESMEISIQDGKMVDGVYVIDRFEFTAFCLLGSAEPCFESAALEMFSCDDFKKQLADMMRELKESLSAAQPYEEGIDSHTKKYSEGGENALEQKNALMAEFGLTPEMLDFNIDDFDIEELRAKFEALKAEAGGSSSDGEATGDPSANFGLEGQFRDELLCALENEKTETCWGTEPRYWFWDYDKDVSEVYATDSTDWNLYGFAYSMDGDHVVIDFDGKKRMKLSLVPFDEGESVNPMTGMFTKMTERYSENDQQWAEKYRNVSDEMESMKSEIGSLRQFKSETENAIVQEKRDALFARFEDLNGIDEFEALRDNCTEYALDALEEKCYAIRGKHGVVASSKFSLEQATMKAPKLVIEKSDRQAEPYGGVFAEYGIKNA